MEKENTNHKNAYFIIYENITDKERNIDLISQFFVSSDMCRSQKTRILELI